MYSHWHTEALKNELRRRGASLKGRKADLVLRLEAYDKNENFDAILCDLDEDPKMLLPEPELYRDINSSMILPPITMENISLYFLEFQKNTNEGKSLYESRYLYVIRAAFQTQLCYIKGLVKATMKKVLYEVNIKINHIGAIEESSCECVAGSGLNAHCKHVAVVLCAVGHWISEKIIIKSQSCTEKLQTFHQPKKLFTESPLQAKTLASFKRKVENVNFNPFKRKIDKNAYNCKVNSIIANWPTDIPLKQLLTPANPYGIDNDHSYCGSITMKILGDLKLTHISSSIIKSVEKETCGQSENAKWKVYRLTRITASMFHTVCHLKEATKKSFAVQMCNRNEVRSRATTHGLINEKIAFQKYKDGFGLEVINCGLHISQERPYLGASPDGLLGNDTVIEIKCPYSSRNLDINHVTVPYLYKEDNNLLQLKMSSPYYYQIQGQLYCTGRQYCNLVVYTYKSMQVVFVTRDEYFIGNMLQKLDSFYYYHFKEAILNKYYYKDYLNIFKKT